MFSQASTLVPPGHGCVSTFSKARSLSAGCAATRSMRPQSQRVSPKPRQPVPRLCRRHFAGIFPRAGGMKLKSHGCQSLWCSTRTHRGVRLAVSPNVRLRRFQIDACVRMTQIEYCNLIDAALCCASSSAALSKSLADMDGCPVRFSR